MYFLYPLICGIVGFLISGICWLTDRALPIHDGYLHAGLLATITGLGVLFVLIVDSEHLKPPPTRVRIGIGLLTLCVCMPLVSLFIPIGASVFVWLFFILFSFTL